MIIFILNIYHKSSNWIYIYHIYIYIINLVTGSINERFKTSTNHTYI